MSEPSEKLRSTDAVAALLYDVLRDHVHPGVVERLVRDIEECHARAQVEGAPCMTYVFSNPHLARYALELSERIKACCAPPAPTSDGR